MIIVFPVCQKDEHLALLNLELCLKMDGKAPYKCILWTDRTFDPSKVEPLLREYFEEVIPLKYMEWNGAMRWPLPNDWAWRSAARIMPKYKDCWFWWEADAVPLKAQWCQAIEAEYRKGKQPFMGLWHHLVDGQQPWVTGVAVFPPDVGSYCAQAMLQPFVTEIRDPKTKQLRPAAIPSFDEILAPAVKNVCHDSQHLIIHGPVVSFASKEDIKAKIPETAVMFHKCKDGSLQNLLIGRPWVEVIKGVFSQTTSGIVNAVKSINQTIEVNSSPITVVITNFKRADKLWNAFQSCKAASVNNIVIGASGTDAALKEVHRKILKLHPEVKINAIPDDRGCNEMWLRGTRLVKTPWTHILHDDDILMPDFRSLESKLKPDTKLVHWAANRVGWDGTEADGVVSSFLDMPEGVYDTDEKLCRLMKMGQLSISPVSALFPTTHVLSVLEECESLKSDPQYHLSPTMMIGNDLLLWLRAVEKFRKFLWVPHPLIAYGNWPGSVTWNDVTKKVNRLPNFYDAMRRYFISHPADFYHMTTSAPPLFSILRQLPGVKPRIIHCVERHTGDSNESRFRKMTALRSWEDLYNVGNVVAAHYTSYHRDSTLIGETRKLPFLKDVLSHAIEQANRQDIILWTNDDTILHQKLPKMLLHTLSKQGAVASHRCDYHPTTAIRINGSLFQSKGSHPGRDLMAFTIPWLEEHWNQIPDYLLGAPCFDIAMAAMIRVSNGCTELSRNEYGHVTQTELKPGYVAHVVHDAAWCSEANRTSKANEYNETLARQQVTRLYPGKSWCEIRNY